MNSLIQRHNECSLCTIATLNGLSQQDYIAISNLARKKGARYGSLKTLPKAIRIGMSIARRLGYFVPADYPGNASPAGAGTTDPVPSAFDGKGIVRIQYKKFRARKWTAHVISFKDGVFYETAGKSYPSWDALADDYKRAKSRDLIITKIFK